MMRLLALRRWDLLVVLLAVALAGCTSLPSAEQVLVNRLEQVVDTSAFSGVVVVAKGTVPLFEHVAGDAHVATQREIQIDDLFVIGSISKQITAVLVLQAAEAGLLRLEVPIRAYMPTLEASWADTVTVHHLLAHTHGVRELGGPLAFEPGTRFEYSQLGYQLLSEIVAHVRDQSFETLAIALFESATMPRSFYPGNEPQEALVHGYIASGEAVMLAEGSLRNYVAAGSFISTAEDLVQWNQQLHGGHLMTEETLTLMQRQHAVRDPHPVFGRVAYGYGLLFGEGSAHEEIGALGYAPGFVSACYYYPASDLSVVVLSNEAHDTNTFQHTFDVHVAVMNLVRDYSNGYASTSET